MFIIQPNDNHFYRRPHWHQSLQICIHWWRIHLAPLLWPFSLLHPLWTGSYRRKTSCIGLNYPPSPPKGGDQRTQRKRHILCHQTRTLPPRTRNHMHEAPWYCYQLLLQLEFLLLGQMHEKLHFFHPTGHHYRLPPCSYLQTWHLHDRSHSV